MIYKLEINYKIKNKGNHLNQNILINKQIHLIDKNYKLN